MIVIGDVDALFALAAIGRLPAGAVVVDVIADEVRQRTNDPLKSDVLSWIEQSAVQARTTLGIAASVFAGRGEPRPSAIDGPRAVREYVEFLDADQKAIVLYQDRWIPRLVCAAEAAVETIHVRDYAS